MKTPKPARTPQEMSARRAVRRIGKAVRAIVAVKDYARLSRAHSIVSNAVLELERLDK